MNNKLQYITQLKPACLKSLELQGYKTFASRTEFVFAGNVTAIVGPNGSGKSNLADALRWVLGEQSYGLLRGKKTEDMIFSGSEQRIRSGMASATITFDNSDSWLPIDFSEVSITRRAYRDGQNEYLLNGQRVRLRDVSELLAQSGLAERTYTIIGQGLVDAALALKAEERRRLFEEAAGIGLHRSRREEALRRLDATRRNLERVEDILAELQPRLRSLERQAKRAQEYEQVKADLRIVLREWYGFHWHRAQLELAEARETARNQELALEQARQVQVRLNDKLEEVRNHISSLRARLEQLHQESARQHGEREACSRQLAVAGERLRSIGELQQDGASQQARLEEEVALLENEFAINQEQALQYQTELAEGLDQASQARQALQEHLAARQETEQVTEKANLTVHRLLAEQARLQARKEEWQTQVLNKQKAMLSLKGNIDGLEKDIKVDEKHQEVARLRVETLLLNLNAGEEELKFVKQELDTMEKARQEAIEVRAGLTAEISRLSAKLDIIEQSEHTLQGYAEGTRVLMEAARKSLLPGVKGALSGYLEAPAELEAALAAALGEYLDGVVITSEDGLDAALDLVIGENARAVLLPLGNLASGRQLAAELVKGLGEGCIGIAAKLVKAPPEMQEVLEVLLGNVVIVRDRGIARRLLTLIRRRNGSMEVRAVTLQGEVFSNRGPVLAGRAFKSGSLSRPRLRRELNIGIDKVKGSLVDVESRIQSLEEKFVSLQENAQKATSLVQNLLQEQYKAETTFNRIQLTSEKSSRQYHWQLEQLQHLQVEIEHARKEDEEISRNLSEILDEVQAAQALARETALALKGLSLEEYQAQLTYWEKEVALSEQALAEVQARQRDRQVALERMQNTLLELRKRLGHVGTEREELIKEKDRLRELESEINRKIEVLSGEIQPAEEQHAVAEREQEQLQREETLARQALTSAEHQHAQAKINLARRQESLEGLRHRIEDDFGLVAFEYTEETSGPTPLPLEGLVEQLPLVEEIGLEIEEVIKRQRSHLRRMGAINPEAQNEFEQVKERFVFLTEQVTDLHQAELDIRQVITELDQIMEREFSRTFEGVAQEFREIFTRLFGGGAARLVLTDPDDITGSGIDIEARLPGRRSQGLSLLSGGERSLTAVALVFALLKVSPTPFCVLDEVDAMLDEVNVGRFRDLLRELSKSTQFVIITHNRNTVQVADVIYGVTMGSDSSSQVISLKLDEVSEVYSTG